MSHLKQLHIRGMTNLIYFFKKYIFTKFVNKEEIVEVIIVDFRKIFIWYYKKVHF